MDSKVQTLLEHASSLDFGSHPDSDVMLFTDTHSGFVHNSRGVDEAKAPDTEAPGKVPSLCIFMYYKKVEIARGLSIIGIDFSHKRDWIDSSSIKAPLLFRLHFYRSLLV